MKPQSEPNQDMSHPPTQAVAQNTVTSPPQVQGTSMVSLQEGFGRGAGPYVDKFVLQDMDQQRMKELEYRVSVSHILIDLIYLVHTVCACALMTCGGKAEN